MPDSPHPERPQPTERRDATALLVLDMFSLPTGGDRRSLRRNAPKAVPAIARLIARAREASIPVIYVDDQHGRWSGGANSLVTGTQDEGLGSLLDPILPGPHDPVVLRARPSAFDRSSLEDLLHDRGVRRLVITGQIAEQSVLYSALDATVRRFRVVVPEDALVGIDPNLISAALRMMDRNMRAEITTADAVDLTQTAGPRPGHPMRAPRLAPYIAPTPGPGDDAPMSETRQQLLTALATVVARQGLGNTKVADIAREARTSLRTFYAEFESKEECFLELHRQLTKTVMVVVKQSVVFDRPWVDVMRGGFETYFEILTAQPRLTHAILVELSNMSDAARRARDDAMEVFGNMLCELVEDGRVANPDIPSRPLSPLIARGIIAAFLELVVSYVDRGETERFPELIDTATEMLTSVVLVSVADRPDAVPIDPAPAPISHA